MTYMQRAIPERLSGKKADHCHRTYCQSNEYIRTQQEKGSLEKDRYPYLFPAKIQFYMFRKSPMKTEFLIQTTLLKPA